MLQSWEYGSAKSKAEGWNPKRFIVMNDIDNPIALVQILHKGLPFIGGAARLNRGPLLIEGKTTVNKTQLKLIILNLLIKESRKQRWWMFQAAPELSKSNFAQFGMKALGFNKLPLIPWASGILPLDGDDQSLLMSFNGKWRNSMRKGEKLGVKVTRKECSGGELDLLLKNYNKLQNKRDFKGLSDSLLGGLAGQKGSHWGFNLFIARDNNLEAIDEDPLGILVSIRSGDTAIYLIGLSNDKGRKMNANSVLLWQAILYANNQGDCRWFDIGGLNQSTPKGIASFKKGLNAIPYNSVGEWRKWQ